MVQVHIEIHRPFALLTVFSLLVGGAIASMHYSSTDVVIPPAAAQVTEPLPAGGQEFDHTALEVQITEEQMKQLRKQHEILRQREEALRYQVFTYERERRIAEFTSAKEMLISLTKDRQQIEDQLRAYILGIAHEPLWQTRPFAMAWPVEPEEGLSARYDDEGYHSVFGVQHRAVDIPVLQGTEVRATADGIVAEVNDRGFGFNSVVIQHAGGYSTLYGHVQQFLVSAGQTVRAGDPIALSGGMPGTLGAGHRTTGPHLHLELLYEGVRIDPLKYLPKRTGI